MNDLWALACLVGQYNNAGICTSCPAGSYSSTYNSTSCALCLANSYSSIVGATANSTCINCPTNMGSIAGSTTCSCAPGFHLNGNSCIACPVGSYKSNIGNTSCITCGANAIPASITSPPCACSGGYQPDGAKCVACPANTYKTSAGNTTCVSCNAIQWSGIAATSCYNDPLATQLSNGASSNVPPQRDGHSFNYDNNGKFWVFGGRINTSNAGYLNSVWRYNRDSQTFSFIDGSNDTGSAAIIANKPSPRADHASWIDNSGNLWVTGGWGLNETMPTSSKYF